MSLVQYPMSVLGELVLKRGLAQKSGIDKFIRASVSDFFVQSARGVQT